MTNEFKLVRFGNSIPERTCFHKAQELSNKFSVTLWGYFDDAGCYVVTDKKQEDYCEMYVPGKKPISEYSGHQ